jgi:hypothetical protein
VKRVQRRDAHVTARKADLVLRLVVPAEISANASARTILATGTYLAPEVLPMMRRLTLWTAAIVLALVAPATAGQKSSVDVTGAWTVTITLSSGEAVTGLAILSQDGSTITGMIGPAETDMMPVEGTVAASKVTLLTRPRAGRTAAFAQCELTATADRMTGTIDTDKGTIEFIRKQRTKPSQPAG